MSVPARLTVVTLGVDELARSVAFYEALGWRRSSASVEGEVAFMIGAGPVLALFGRDALADDAGLPATPRAPFGGVTLAVNVEREEQVAEALEDASRAGAAILKPATRAEWGGVSGYFADPDGHPWEIAWVPGFWFRPDGMLDLP